LEAKCFRLSRFKMQYIKCDFSATTQEEENIRLDGHVVPRMIPFDTWDRCSKRIGTSMKMLVIELKLIG
jgi:hypothetical protein